MSRQAEKSWELPSETAALRACTVCHRVLEQEAARHSEHCPCCNEKSSFTAKFRGLVSVVDPENPDSYVVRLLQQMVGEDRVHKGLYAIRVDASSKEDIPE